MGRRVERTRAAGKWTEAKYWGHIRGALRQAFLRYPVRSDVKRTRAVRHGRKTYYECDSCSDLFTTKEVAVDHIEPCGSLKKYEDLPGFVERLFCEEDNLQLLCNECHATKTKADNAKTRSKQ